MVSEIQFATKTVDGSFVSADGSFSLIVKPLISVTTASKLFVIAHSIGISIASGTLLWFAYGFNLAPAGY